MKMNLRKTTLATAALVLAAPSAYAVKPADLGLTDQQVRLLTAGTPLSGTGVSFGSPSAFGLNWREAGVGVGGTYDPHVPAGSKEADGSIVVAMGLGDAQKAVGLEVAAGIYSTLNQGGNDEFASDGGLAAKLHTVLPYRSAFAVGVENFARWGDAAKKGRTAAYVVGTKFVDLNPNGRNKVPVALNLGLGNGRFTEIGHSDQSVNVFGGIAVNVLPQASLVADWTGRDLNAAVNVAPFSSLGVIVSLGGINLTEQDGNNAAYAANVGYTFRF